MHYFQNAGCTPENRLATASETLAIFLSQTLSQQTEMRPALRQLCVQVSCAIHSHSSVADHFQDVSLITRNGKLMGVKLNMTVPHFEHPEIVFKSCYAFAHNCARLTASEILREGVDRPSAAQFPDWLYTSGFIVVPKYVKITRQLHTLRHNRRCFVKQASIATARTRLDRFVYTGKREIVNPIISPSV